MRIYSAEPRESIFDFLNNSTAILLISIAIMLFAGFLLTRVTKKLKLPNVTAYIVTGVILGPIFYLIFGKTLVSDVVVNGMGFLGDVALAFIAFNAGRFFKISVLKESGGKVVVIALFEALLAAILVFSVMFFIFSLSWQLSILLGAIASATSPASTMMTIRQTKSKGHFANTILQVIALDSAISLLLFSISLGIVTSNETTGGFTAMDIFMPILINLGILVLGGLVGWVLHKLIIESRTTDNRLIILLSLLMALTGFAVYFNVSPLLGCMAMGMVYLNLSKDTSIFSQLDQFSPAILSLFFVLSGMKLRLDMLGSIGLIGIVYFVVRIIGKYVGASLGSLVSNSTPENKKYLGLALIPQAGVAIGLAALGSRVLDGVGLATEAAMLSTIIVAAGVLYEIFGPPSAKLSLHLSKSYEIEKPQHN
jgi:Kef-type K+ transport system membrane component KefB